MSLASVFKSSTGGNASPAFHFPSTGHPTFVQQPKHTGSFLGNLAGDIRDAAVGLPEGLIQTVEHPIRMGEASAKMTWGDWAPLIHGHPQEWYQRFHSHPLGPILDVASIATTPLSIAGGAAKAAEATARVAGAADVADRIAPIAAKFRPQTRVLDALPGEPQGAIHYHGNPLIRARQKSLEKMKNVLTNDSDAKRQARYLDRKISEHHVATGAMFVREYRAAKALFKDKSVTATDIVNVMRPHIRRMLEDHAFEIDPKNAQQLDRSNFDFLATGAQGKGYYPKDKTPHEFAQWIKTEGADNTTGDINRAMRTHSGNYLVVRKDEVRNFIKEGRNTYAALDALWNKPTQVWKWLVLATAPRYFVNNVVGNAMMYAMSANPVATSRGLYHTMAATIGKHRALRGLSQVDKAMAKLDGDWQNRWYLGAHQGFSGELTGIAEGKGQTATKFSKATRVGYTVTHNVSDLLPRRMAINYIIKRNPEYQQLFKQFREEGRGTLEAHRLAADKASENPFVRDWVESETNNVLGQYHHWSPLESQIRTFVPFYSWMRAITRHTMHMASERPVEAVAMANAGQMGVKQTQKELGKIPDFMKGYIPLGGGKFGGILGKILGPTHAGRKMVLSTQGLNPYASFGDVADMVGSMVSGHAPGGEEAVATSLLPTVQAAIQHVTGQSLMTGAKIKKHGGFLEDVLYQTFAGTPQGVMLQTAINGTPHPKVDKRTGKTHGPLLFHNDEATLLRSYLGIPVKDEAPTTAASMADKEQGIKKGRQRKPSIPQFKLTAPKGSKPRTSKYRVRKTVRRQAAKGLHGLGMSSFHVKNDLPKIKF